MKSVKNVDVLNGKIHTVAYGTGSQPLLIIHGGPDWDHTYLADAAKELSQERQVILFDIRGCGKSSRFDDESAYTIENIVTDIEAICIAYKIESCAVLGFSFGGIVAMHLLSEKPELVSKLILASTTAYQDYQHILNSSTGYANRNTSEIRELIKYSFTEAVVNGQEPSRSMALGSLPLDVHDLNKLGNIKNVISNIEFSSEWIKAFRSGLLKIKPLDAEELIKKSNSPILVIHGEQDLRFPVDVAIRLGKSQPKICLHILNGAGHLAHLEKQSVWTSHVSNFLNK